MSLRACIAAFALATSIPPAAAFFIPTGPPPTDPVYEYFNSRTGHYFYTWSPGDQQALDSGAFGAGWMRTGQAFSAYGTRDRARVPYYPVDGCAGQESCLPVWRFYAPGPNSHFFTGSPGDVAILGRPGTGWFLENVAFYTAMPDAAGKCATGKAPVYRLYNNRAALNDTNHRYTADAAARQLMIARGWVDEGVAFCAFGKGVITTETHRFRVSSVADIMPLVECRSRTDSGSCLGLLGLPMPSYPFTSASSGMQVDEFDRQTGYYYYSAPPITMAVAGPSRAAAAADAFVQFHPAVYQAGIRLTPRSRTGGPYSGISALHRLAAGQLRPYELASGTERELYLQASLAVQKSSAPPDSHAYGVFSLQFRDETSGRGLLFNAIAFGTLGAAEGVGRDLHTSLPIVYTAFATPGRFAFLAGSLNYGMPSPTPPQNGFFQAWIGRRHFQAILDAARQVDPLLSPRPEDYSVASFGLVNEAYGDGEIGLVVNDISLSLKGAE